MNNDLSNNNGLMTFFPKCGCCYDFLKGNHSSKKTIWLVPHVIKFREESLIIIWRCNWGNACESGCIYAMAKEKNELALTNLAVNNKT